MTRFICKQNRQEIELVKDELVKAGIAAEVRSNPLAEALRLSRVELWLEDDTDIFEASRIYAEVQARNVARSDEEEVVEAESSPTEAEASEVDEQPLVAPQEGDPEVAVADYDLQCMAEVPPAEAPTVTDEQQEQVGIEASEAISTEESPQTPIHEEIPATAEQHDDAPVDEVEAPPAELPANEITEASALLEQEIEQLLQHESELETTCSALHMQAEQLNLSLLQLQTELTQEREQRAETDKKHADELSALQSNFEKEQGERSRVEQELQQERSDFQQQVKDLEQAIKDSQEQLEAKAHQLQAQQAAIIELRSEIASREAQKEELEKALATARAETSSEKEARVLAEEQTEKTEAAKAALELQTVQQNELQRQAYTARLHSIRTRLHGKRANVPAQNP